MKNKILPILFIFILIIFSLINNVFAAETNTLTVDGYDMSDVYNYFSKDDAFFIYKLNGAQYLISVPTDETYKSYNATGFAYEKHCFFYLNTNKEYTFRYKFYIFNTSTLKFDYSYTGTINGDHNVDNMEILYSSKGILNDDLVTFFVKPPAPTTLAGVLEEANPTKTFQTMMSGIIPYLIALVIGLVAFWKAWQILLRELRKA